MKKTELTSTEAAVEAKLEAKADPEMLVEYDFRGGRRGVYAERYAQGTNLVHLAPDVAAVFPDSESVNAALRAFVRATLRDAEAQTLPNRDSA